MNKISKKDKIKKFTINNFGELCYENKVIGESKSIKGFTKFNFYPDPIGTGANAIVFKAKHKSLEINQVIKIYFPHKNEKDSADKIRKEAIKNSNPIINDISATVYDSGKYEFPITLYYSVMENLNDYVVLKDYLKTRDDLINTKKRTEAQNKNLISLPINTSIGILFSILKLHSNNITHGDLNDGNILIKSPNIDQTFDDVSFNIGRIDPLKVKLIDLGTSQFRRTNKEKAIRRENWFIFSSIKEILKSNFKYKNISFEDCLNIKLIDKKSRVPIIKDKKGNDVDCYELASDLLRLVFFINILSGLEYNEGGYLEMQYLEIRELNTIMSSTYRLPSTDIYDSNALAAWEMLYKNSTGQLINWERLFNSFKSKDKDISNYKVYTNHLKRI